LPLIDFVSAFVARLEQQLAEKLAAPVKIKDNGQGKGQICIDYHSLEALQGILEKID
jgi:ParB family chromosome partitioning protein